MSMRSTPRSRNCLVKMVVWSRPLAISVEDQLPYTWLALGLLASITHQNLHSPWPSLSLTLASSARSVPSYQSVAETRNINGFSHLERAISVISSARRNRFSSDPPYWSLRSLEMGDRKSGKARRKRCEKQTLTRNGCLLSAHYATNTPIRINRDQLCRSCV
jgi:hypothetical protein